MKTWCVHFFLFKADEGENNYICKIVEMFEDIDGELYFTAQWYYRAKDTVRYLVLSFYRSYEIFVWNHCLIISSIFQVIKKLAYLVDSKRVFFSEIQDDNPLDCLVEKLKIARIPLNVHVLVKIIFCITFFNFLL